MHRNRLIKEVPVDCDAAGAGGENHNAVRLAGPTQNFWGRGNMMLPCVVRAQGKPLPTGTWGGAGLPTKLRTRLSRSKPEPTFLSCCPFQPPSSNGDVASVLLDANETESLSHTSDPRAAATSERVQNGAARWRHQFAQPRHERRALHCRVVVVLALVLLCCLWAAEECWEALRCPASVGERFRGRLVTSL